MIKSYNSIVFHLAKILGRFLPILIFCCIAGTALSQTARGRVVENITAVVVSSASVKVAGGTAATLTNIDGEFEISAKVNDLLIISAAGYNTDTLLLTNTRFKEIYLSPRVRELKEVKVNADNVAPTANFGSYDPDYHNQTIAKQLDDKGNYKGGVIFRVWYWKKDEKKRAKDEQTQKVAAAYRQIHEVFCRDTLLKYLPLKNEEVAGFIYCYSPGVEEYMSPGFSMAFYLNKSYKEFEVLPVEERVKQVD